MSNRWWIYQKERFPIFKNGLLIALFSVSAVGYAALLQPQSTLTANTIASAVIAFIVLFLFFLQLRIADEFKDYHEDVQFRSYRPVPRGVVSLTELSKLAIASAVIQFGLTLSIGLNLLPFLLLVWGYMLLMGSEFFVPQWLKAHPLIYMVSHMVIMPLMALYAIATQTVRSAAGIPLEVGCFLLLSFFGGMVIEVGRKIRAPQDEEQGVETYTALWGKQRAIAAWLSAIWLMAIAGLWAARSVQFAAPVALLLLFLLTLSVVTAWQFQTRLTTQNAAQIELVSALWTLLLYPAIGFVPLLVV